MTRIKNFEEFINEERTQRQPAMNEGLFGFGGNDLKFYFIEEKFIRQEMKNYDKLKDANDITEISSDLIKMLDDIVEKFGEKGHVKNNLITLEQLQELWNDQSNKFPRNPFTKMFVYPKAPKGKQSLTGDYKAYTVSKTNRMIENFISKAKKEKIENVELEKFAKAAKNDHDVQEVESSREWSLYAFCKNLSHKYCEDLPFKYTDEFPDRDDAYIKIGKVK